MTCSVNLHRATKAEAHQSEGTSWLQFQSRDGDYVCIFMPYVSAKAMADQFMSEADFKKNMEEGAAQ